MKRKMLKSYTRKFIALAKFELYIHRHTTLRALTSAQALIQKTNSKLKAFAVKSINLISKISPSTWIQLVAGSFGKHTINTSNTFLSEIWNFSSLLLPTRKFLAPDLHSPLHVVYTQISTECYFHKTLNLSRESDALYKLLLAKLIRLC